MVEGAAVLLDQCPSGQLFEGKGAQLAAREAAEALQVESGELELLGCPLCPLVHLLLCPMSWVWNGSEGREREREGERERGER